MFLIGLLLLLSPQAPPAPDYWGSLVPGSHAIGFSQRWLIDSTRYLPGGDSLGLRFRPVLMNLWYPATRTGTPMRYGDYFEGAERAVGARNGLARYARALVAHSRRIARQETVGEQADSMPELERRFESLLARATAVARDLPMRRTNGPRPVVVYASGAGSSYDDNAVLCEYLASHGYLVVGSAFPREDNADLSTSASDESRQRDIRRLVLEVSRLPGVELGPVAAIGHSAGAQALLLFATDPSAPIDAVLALDTTQDYARLSDRTWAYYTDRVVEMRFDVKLPIVLVAGPEALFELGDSLVAARRWFVEAPDLSHNDFISQGVIRREITAGLVEHDSAAARRARSSYEALVTFSRVWLDWFAAGGSGGELALQAPAPLRIAYAPVGERSPVIATGVPTARALRHLYSTAPGKDFVDAALEARAAGDPAGGDDVIGMLLTGTLAGGDRAKARAVYASLAARDSTVRSVVERLANRARLFERYSVAELAAVWWGYAAALDPTIEVPAAYRP